MVPAALAVPVVKELISAGAQYMACREQEKTKRAAIARNLAAFHAEVDAKAAGIYARQREAFWDGAEYVTQGADALAHAMDAGDDAAIDAVLQVLLKGKDAKP